MLYISPGMLEWIIEHATSSTLSSQKPPSEGFFLPAKGFSGANIMVMKCFPTFDEGFGDKEGVSPSLCQFHYSHEPPASTLPTEKCTGPN